VSAPRVIAGRFGGRVLKTPRGLVTRPTGARVRGALFNVLGDLAGARVLDLYAGSGALGLEALSRGATHLVLVEEDRAALACVETNVATLGVAASAHVLAGRLPRAIATVASYGPFDLVLCDPPWADVDKACGALAEVAAKSCLAADARVVLEHAAKQEDPVVAGLVLRDRRAWGDTAVSFFGLA
jgi:16S rRNA (guanine966-N2)-methyltransferase